MKNTDQVGPNQVNTLNPRQHQLAKHLITTGGRNEPHMGVGGAQPIPQQRADFDDVIGNGSAAERSARPFGCTTIGTAVASEDVFTGRRYRSAPGRPREQGDPLVGCGEFIGLHARDAFDDPSIDQHQPLPSEPGR